MSLDFVISGARLAERPGLWDIAVGAGRIRAIARKIVARAPRVAAKGALAFGGFVDCHIHLDKALLLDRCAPEEGTLAEAVRLTAAAKAEFTVEDVAARAAEVARLAVLQGTTRLRSFVELDPRVGDRAFRALIEVRAAMAPALDIDLCAFAQEGTTREPETLRLLAAALDRGATSVGGCPYTDPDPAAHLAAIFDLAVAHDVPVDFHVDFDLEPRGAALPEIAALTRRHGWQGRVSVGHATKLSAMGPEEVTALGRMLADAGIAVTALPATDLFLLGRDRDRLVPRGLAPLPRLRALGVRTAVASNNILNPFTPYGDASLCRMANLYANVAQLSREADLAAAFDMVTSAPAAQLGGAPYGPREGGPADIVLIAAPSPAEAVRRVAPVIRGWKAGRPTFERPPARPLWDAAAR
ncbi:amidohydrolase family protein [Amaricoccus solimangrovi]|uniref:Amidohydrolase family protein n=1 Tax=Amaricoccus solimangrovi TaxID=2589815 RepID=A0A501WMX7_9RHOB|nr:amidohydrolase family protein [Amaricoccus solimangrovi]TPE49554.1 amidohydrolase family protein [Amaricoccus solimangrovi]